MSVKLEGMCHVQLYMQYWMTCYVLLNSLLEMLMCLFNFVALYRALLIVRTDPKCSEVLNAITFGLKCNTTLNVI